MGKSKNMAPKSVAGLHAASSPGGRCRGKGGAQDSKRVGQIPLCNKPTPEMILIHLEGGVPMAQSLSTSQYQYNGN